MTDICTACGDPTLDGTQERWRGRGSNFWCEYHHPLNFLQPILASVRDCGDYCGECFKENGTIEQFYHPRAIIRFPSGGTTAQLQCKMGHKWICGFAQLDELPLGVIDGAWILDALDGRFSEGDFFV